MLIKNAHRTCHNLTAVNRVSHTFKRHRQYVTTGTVTVNVCGRIHTFKCHRQYVTTGTVTVDVCAGIHRIHSSVIGNM